MKPACKRLVVLNNYSLERVWQEVNRGKKPAHHLFGIDHLQRRGWEVTIAPCPENRKSVGLGAGVAGMIRRLFDYGDIAQQRFAWALRGQADLIYAPCQTQTGLLAIARLAGLRVPPLAVIAHHPVGSGKLRWMRDRFSSLIWQGVDLPLALGTAVAGQISGVLGGRHSPRVLEWGPDLKFYDSHRRGGGSGIISCGRTGRDFALLAEASKRTDLPVTIVCLQREAEALTPRGGPKLNVIAAQSESDMDYSKLLSFFADAAVHAIPLASGAVLSGLTSLCDAVALGRAVLMTRNPFVNVDIESEGFGRWIEPGDLNGWHDALRWVESRPEEVRQMGVRAAEFADKRMNYARFCSSLESALERMLDASA